MVAYPHQHSLVIRKAYMYLPKLVPSAPFHILDKPLGWTPNLGVESDTPRRASAPPREEARGGRELPAINGPFLLEPAGLNTLPIPKQ